MPDFPARLASLQRPRLLIRAARCGLVEYRRDRDLRRLIGAAPPTPEAALPRLLSQEALLEEDRLAGSATYSLIRHVELLIAVMAEARLLPREATG